MNCQEFRCKTQTDPLRRDNDMLAHEDGCADCAAFARDLRAREIRLRAALQRVSAPADLADRVRLAARAEHRAALRQRWHSAAAAGLLLLAGVYLSSFSVLTTPGGQPVLVTAVLEHIDAESHHLRATGRVSVARMQALFERFGARLIGDLGLVRFAGECLMRNKTGIHLVLPGRFGPVTVFFMPDETPQHELPVASDSLTGTIVPTDWGSIAVVGESGEAIGEIGRRMTEAVAWPIGARAMDGPAFQAQ